MNDNAPKMDIPQDCISISEFHDVRDLIYIIKVKDADDPTTSNGRVIIKITSGNELGAQLISEYRSMKYYVPQCIMQYINILF